MCKVLFYIVETFFRMQKLKLTFIMDYDKIFGLHGERGWPGDVGEAKFILRKVFGAKSSSQCFDDSFFHPYKSNEELWPESRESAWIKEEERRELFNDVQDWPLSVVVASAVYKIFTEMCHFSKVYTWSQLLWVFLSFKEHIFDMVQAKGWVDKNEVREGFKQGLAPDLRNYGGEWGDDWFKRRYVNTKIYSQDVLRCLRLAGVDEDVAGLAVNQVFKSQSLIPFYEALSDNVTITSIVSILPSGKDQNSSHSEGKNLIENITALFGVAAFLFCLFYRRQSYIPTPATMRQGTIAQVSIGGNPCFAAIRMGGINTRRPREEDKNHSLSLNRSSPERGQKMQNLQGHSSTHFFHRSSSSQPDEENPYHFVTRSALSLSRLSPQRVPDLKVSTIQRVQTFTKSMFGIQDSATRIVNTKLKWRSSYSREEQQNEEIEVGSLKESEQGGKKLSWMRGKSNKVAARQELASHRVSDTSEEESGKPIKSNKYKHLFKKFLLQGPKVYQWIDGEKIFTENSPEVKKFRKKLDKMGQPIPAHTSLCIHLKKDGNGKIVFRTHGTVAPFGRQADIRKVINQHFTVEGKNVQFPSKEIDENDHVTMSPVAEPFDTRHKDKSQDRSITIRIPRELHSKRTNDPEIMRLKLDLTQLTNPLPVILKPLRVADRALWLKPEHRSDILKTGLTSEYLADQSDRAHNIELSRMVYEMTRANFNGKQALAFILDGMLQSAITVSANKFLNFEPPPPFLRGHQKFTAFQLEHGADLYYQKLREYNKPEFITRFTQYAHLGQALESYSISPEGRLDLCTPEQTKRHKTTKVKAIDTLETTLTDGLMEEGGIKTTMNAIRKSTQDLAESLTADTAKDLIVVIGKELEIDRLGRRKAVMSMAVPILEERNLLYKDSMENAQQAASNVKFL